MPANGGWTLVRRSCSAVVLIVSAGSSLNIGQPLTGLGVEGATWEQTAPRGRVLTMPAAEYEDRIRATWYGQIAGTLMGFAFEHRAAATALVDRIPDRFKGMPIDDDWYYEMVAVRAFERFGITMTAAQLGEQWKLNSAGAWGSSEQARLLLARGIIAPDTGHPRYNRLWFTIGPQFSADVYGMITPGMPNTAARIAREYGHVNGYAEGADGASFMAGMVSLAFIENDPRQVVRKAARLIHPRSPYRQALDLVVTMAEAGASAEDVAIAVEDRWHVEYPATNNAVANGALTAMAVWFGAGDWLLTVNHAFRAADFTDADCNAANAGAVVGAMKGTRGLPSWVIDRLGDRIAGDQLGSVKLTPPVDESLAELSKRTAAIGRQFVVANKGSITSDGLTIAVQEAETQPAELFQTGDFMQYLEPRVEAAARRRRRRRWRHARDPRKHSPRRGRAGELSARRGARGRVDAADRARRRATAARRRRR